METLRVLRQLTGRLALVFPGERHVHREMSENTLRALLIRAGYYQRHVPHCFRAAFSTIMNEWGGWLPLTASRCQGVKAVRHSRA